MLGFKDSTSLPIIPTNIVSKSLSMALAQADGMPLSASGDKFVVDNQGNFLMKIAGDAKHAETFWYGKTYYPVPEIVGLWYGFNRVLSSLWQQRD